MVKERFRTRVVDHSEFRLIEAAALAQCDVRLGLVSLHEVIGGEVPYEPSRSRRRWGWGAPVGMDTEVDPENFEAYDTIESDFFAQRFGDTGRQERRFWRHSRRP